MRPPNVLDVAADNIHADAAAGNVGDFFGGRKAGQENKIVDLIVAQNGISADQSPLPRLLEHALGD